MRCSPLQKEGYAIHLYTATASMQDTSLTNADGDFLIVPQSGAPCSDLSTCLRNSIKCFIWHQLEAVQAHDWHLPGTLHIRTEFGRLEVPSGHICIVQCGMRFSVDLAEQECVQGYVLEIFGQHFTLPELGPIGESLYAPQFLRLQGACSP